MGSGPNYGTALAGCERTPAGQRHTGRQISGPVKNSEKTQLAWSRPRRVWQRLDDRVGIRQPVKEAEARDTGPPACREVCRTRTVQRLTYVMNGCVTKQRTERDICERLVCVALAGSA